MPCGIGLDFVNIICILIKKGKVAWTERYLLTLFPTAYPFPQIERVQKCAMAIILGNKYINYEKATEELCLENLSDRRLKLSKNFAKKAAKSPKIQNWFNEIQNRDNRTSTRSCKNKSLPKFKPIPTRTNRYKKSPLPYLTDILNELNSKKSWVPMFFMKTWSIMLTVDYSQWSKLMYQ